MTLSLILDIAVAPRASDSSAPVFFLIGAFVIIVGMETIILQLLGWGTFRRSFVDALVMNMVTTLIGAVGLFVMPILVALPIALVSSILIEGLILMRRRNEHSLRKIWLASIVANLASYALVFFLPLSFS